jgi:hypothetical protein
MEEANPLAADIPAPSKAADKTTVVTGIRVILSRGPSHPLAKLESSLRAALAHLQHSSRGILSGIALPSDLVRPPVTVGAAPRANA